MKTGHCSEDLLESTWVEFLSVDSNSLPQATYPEQISISEIPEVSGMQEAATERSASFASILVIVEHPRLGIETDFADMTIRKHSTPRRDDPDRCIWMSPSCTHDRNFLVTVRRCRDLSDTVFVNEATINKFMWRRCIQRAEGRSTNVLGAPKVRL